MIAPEGQPVLTAAQMRAAEDAAIAAGVDVDRLMHRAGTAVAAAVRRLAAGRDVLILCGPGNNGGDGYVAATALAEVGIAVRVAATGEPRTDVARRARAGWSGPVGTLADAAPAAILVDALFGTGLARPLDAAVAVALGRLAAAAEIAIAVDLPSGVATDDGALLSEPPVFTLTLALGAIKPAHLLQPAARHAGTVRILDIGLAIDGAVRALAPPDLAAPGPDSHKYSRGMVAVVAGSMAGAADLAALSALRAGAGYALLLTDTPGATHAIVRRPFADDALIDERIDVIVIGPGLGRDDDARRRLDAAFASHRPLVVDGDALHLVTPDRLRAHPAPVIVTPHDGEFRALFGHTAGSKIDRALAAATISGAVVVYKGPDTVVAASDGRVRIATHANGWLSTAGTGDVLAGTVGAMLAAGHDPFTAAAAAVWLHADAARRCGASFIADDLADALTPARAAT